MLPILKLLLFVLLAFAVLLAGFKAYVYFNAKINGSRTLLALVFYALSLIAINIGLIIGGMLALVYVYEWLS
jgi:heme/copper-type cytochrome/quinol oxidase subunit 2